MRAIKLVAAFMTLLSPGCDGGKPNPDLGTVSETDRAVFIREAASFGQFHLASSELALKRSQNVRVKELAERILWEHKDYLAKLSEESAVTVEPRLASDHRQRLDHLANLPAEKFDYAFLMHEYSVHVEAAKKFAAFSKRSPDRLGSWASNWASLEFDHSGPIGGLLAATTP